MLLKDFYTLEKTQQEDNKIESTICLNPHHAIYQGHFPQQAIVPGVCMMQMLVETAALALKLEGLKISTAQQIKFLRPIVPLENPNLSIITTYNQSDTGAIKVHSKITNGEHIFFKFKGLLSQ